jgi:ABC-type transporter MlaC component
VTPRHLPVAASVATLCLAASVAFAALAKKAPAAPAKAPVVAPAAAAVADPVARTQALIAAFQKVPARVKGVPSDKGFAELDGFLDFDAITQDPIRPHLAKLDAKQRAEYTAKFREVVRLVAYPDTGAFFRSAKVKVGAARPGNGGSWVDLDTRSPEDSVDVRVGLLWKSVGGTLKVADLTFDGDSLIRDYQNQFGRILTKEGAAGLLKRLEDKRAELGRK